MVHGRGGASRRLSFLVLTTSAFGATAAVAPAQPVHALVLPRQNAAAAESDDAAQPGASVAMQPGERGSMRFMFGGRAFQRVSAARWLQRIEAVLLARRR